MNSIILIGNKESSDQYVLDFIQSHEIKPYYVERFSDTMKISQVRELKKKLSIKLGKSENRLFVIEGSLTTEAQNALLKTFEESADWVYFLICVSAAQNVLPTILSRCQLVFLTPQVPQAVDQTADFSVLGQNSYIPLYSLFEQFQFFATMEDLEQFMYGYRSYILKEVASGHLLPAQLTLRFIQLCESYPLIKSNNINRRSAIETAIITPYK